jgi:DNA invertase Pin-like site-specific DNA recombinase
MNDYNNLGLLLNQRRSCRDRSSPDDVVRVVDYSRVSTDHLAQMSAYDNQVSWLRMAMSYHPNWKHVRSFEEPAVSGTSTRHREQFQSMVAVAEEAHRKGEEAPFDLILCREISRFARNLLDSILYIRKFREYNVEIYFVQENIFTFQEGVELQLAILSQMAESESRHISMRVRAGQAMSRHQFFTEMVCLDMNW